MGNLEDSTGTGALDRRREIHLDRLRQATVGATIAALMLLPPSCLSVGRTFAYVPHESVETLLELGVDDYVFYERDQEFAADSMARFRGLRSLGKGVYLVLGKDVNATSDAEEAFASIASAVGVFGGEVDGFILWDDPLIKGGSGVRNEIAARLREHFPNVTFGAGLDVHSLTREEKIALSAGDMGPLCDLDLGLYDFIVPYSYGWIYATDWDMDMIRELQGTYDPGITYWLWHSVRGAQNIGSLYGPEVWFVLNAHSLKAIDSAVVYTTTTTQMLWDLLVVREAGITNVGWFTFDGSEYFGNSSRSRPDGWIRYYFLKDTLVSIAKMESPSALSARIDQQEDEMASINRSVVMAIEAAMNQIGARLEELEAAINSTTAELGDANTNLSALRYAMTQLEDLIRDLSALFSEQSADLIEDMAELNTTLHGELALLQASLERATLARYQEIGSGMDELRRSIQALQGALEGTRTEIEQSVGELIIGAGARDLKLSGLSDAVSEGMLTLAINQTSMARDTAQLREEVRTQGQAVQVEMLEIREEIAQASRASRSDMEELAAGINATYQDRQDDIVARLESISARLSEAERSNRRLSVLVCLTLVITAATLILCATTRGRRLSKPG